MFKEYLLSPSSKKMQNMRSNFSFFFTSARGKTLFSQPLVKHFLCRTHKRWNVFVVTWGFD
ncbi:hypothetical protein E0L10_07560 [Enterococcus durans]|nr:hypothetical protein [Enterococcus durans]